ncbi:MAG TPA: helix-turn-helix transcriptional regulator [Tepidisphaeraceae bacterium]|nr:helix-turn-helix transcriptional regulator [Tepidisphaeraceae bacterium]
MRRLKNGAEHAQAKRLYLRLSTGKADQGKRQYIQVLVDLMGEYERRAGFALDTSKLTAVDLIQHRLEARGMSVAALAKEVGIPQPNLSAMLAGKRDWSKAAIRSLSAFFHIRAERFLQ